MQAEVREPKKGAGVPRETPQQNSLEELKRIMGAISSAAATDLAQGIVGAGYFQAGLNEQFAVAAKVMAERLGERPLQQKLLHELLAHPDPRIRGYAAHLVPQMYSGDLPSIIKGLKLTGVCEGAWVQELSQSLLHALTVKHGLDAVLSLVKDWVNDRDPNVRRLVIEALRPRGVMCPHISELKADPSILKPLLTTLLDDPSLYVRNAVANNLNDISRDHPDLLLKWCQEWYMPTNPERSWVIDRALRTLLKQGNQQALELMNFDGSMNVKAEWISSLPHVIRINQFIPFEITVHNQLMKSVGVFINIILESPGIRRPATRRSQFFLWKGRLEPGQERAIKRRIHFADRNSQQKLKGLYHIVLMINGKELERRQFNYE